MHVIIFSDGHRTSQTLLCFGVDDQQSLTSINAAIIAYINTELLGKIAVFYSVMDPKLSVVSPETDIVFGDRV